MPAPARAANDHYRLTRRIVAGALLAGLVIIGLTATMLWRLTQQQLSAGLTQLSALDLLVAAKTQQTFDSADVVLDSIADDLQAAGVASSQALQQATGDEASYRLLRAKMAEVPAFEALSILDAAGNVVNRTRSYPVAPPVNLANSDFFLRLRDHPEFTFYVSRSQQNRADGSRPTYIAKRLNAPNGAFVGVLLGAIRPGYFEGLYASDLDKISGPGSSIALWRKDGILLARTPQVPEATQPSDDADASPLGSVDSAAFWKKDGDSDVAIARVSLDQFPLMVELRQSAGAVLQQWNSESLATLFGGGALLVLIGMGVWLLLRQVNAATLAGEERARADREAQARADILQAMSQAETALRDAQRSEARFRDIVEVGSDWIWETDAQHRFTLVAGARRPKVNLIGMTRWEHAGADPQTDPKWREHQAQLDAHQPFRQFRFGIQLPDGRVDVCVSGKPVFDDDGSFAGYRGTVSDESELIAAREQAARADALLRNAIESIAEGFVIYDAEDRFVMCNDAYRKMYPENAAGFVPGVTYEQIMRQALATGRYPDAAGREEEWLAERINKHREGGEDEARLADGRWVMRSEHQMADGGIAGLRIDITALKAVQNSLHESQAMLNRAQRLSGTGSVVRNLKTDTLEWSDEMYRIFGLDRQTFTPSSTNFLEHIHPDDRSMVKNAREAGHKGVQVAPIEFRIIQSDGTIRWVYRDVELIRDDSGDVASVLTTYKDITEQREASARQREKEAILNRAQRVGRMGSIFRDFACDKSDWSDEMFRILGVARESFTPSTTAFLAMVHAEDRAAVEKSLKATPRQGEHDTVQFRIIRPDGSLRWLHREAERLYDNTGRATGAIATFQDITELQLAQEALRENQAMLNRAQRVAGVGSVLHDFRTRTSQWSEQMYRITGLDPLAAPPSPGRVLAIIHPEDRERVEQSLSEAAAGRDPPALEYRIVRADGTVRMLHREAEVWHDAEGRPIGRLSTFQDITELHLAQETLRENQAMLNRAQRVAAVGSGLRSLKTNRVEWSDEMFRLFGFTRDSFDPGDTEALLEFIHPDDRAQLRQAMEDNRHGMPAEPLQFRIIRGDGSLRWVYREAEVFHDRDGQPSEFLTTYKDVTDHVTNEARLRELEAMLRDAIESIQAGFVIHDAEDRLVICNEAYRRFHADVADLLVPGAYFGDILRAQFARHDWPEIKGREAEWIADWLRERRTITTPTEKQMHDGRWVLVSERPMANGWLAELRVDITELKNVQQSLYESRKRLDRTQQVAHLGTVERDLRSDKVVWSDETYRIFGVNRGDFEPSAENLVKFVHPEDRDLLASTLRRTHHEHANTSLKFRIIRPTGEVRTIFSQADTIYDEAGRPMIVSVAMMDITEREIATHRQIELETQLRHSEKLTALGTLAGGIAHDLNNTLVPIQALSKLVMNQFPPETPARGDLETIYQASLQARDLVRQILAFSRKQEIIRAPTDVGAKVREALQMLRASVPSTIELVEHIGPVPMILADGGQLQQVVVNLVTNGAHAIGDAVGRVTVSVDEVRDAGSPTGRLVRLRVADTGCGMSTDVMHRIFEPFFTTKGVGEGTGLGLSVVHGIVTSQGGSIEVKSTPGKGSEFIILLPAQTVPEEEDVSAVA